jgi:hypothetical protein
MGNPLSCIAIGESIESFGSLWVTHKYQCLLGLALVARIPD